MDQNAHIWESGVAGENVFLFSNGSHSLAAIFPPHGFTMAHVFSMPATRYLQFLKFGPAKVSGLLSACTSFPIYLLQFSDTGVFHVVLS
jgi:hypothetical protein